LPRLYHCSGVWPDQFNLCRLYPAFSRLSTVCEEFSQSSKKTVVPKSAFCTLAKKTPPLSTEGAGGFAGKPNPGLHGKKPGTPSNYTEKILKRQKKTARPKWSCRPVIRNMFLYAAPSRAFCAIPNWR